MMRSCYCVPAGRRMREEGAPVAQHVAHGMLHEAVGKDDPQRGKVAGNGHHPDGEAMHLFAHALPAEGPDRHEGGLQEEGHRGLDGQQGAENVADEGGIARPVGAELEFQRDAGDHAEHEIDEEELAQELDHALVVFIPGAHVDGLHDGKQHGEPEREGHEDEVKEHGHGKLKAGKKYQIHDVSPDVPFR